MVLGHYIDPNTFVMRQPVMVDPDVWFSLNMISFRAEQ